MCKGPAAAPPVVTLCLPSPLHCPDSVDGADFPPNSQPVRVGTGTASYPLFSVQQPMRTRGLVLSLQEGAPDAKT